VEEFDPEKMPEPPQSAPSTSATFTATVSAATNQPPTHGVPDNREAMIESARSQLLASREGKFSLDATLLRWEDAYIEAARRQADGNISQAARLLGINRTTLYNRLDTLARERLSISDAEKSR